MASENEQEKRETLADIVADMRNAGALMPVAYMRDLLNYAERIEAIDSADAWRSLYTPPVVNAAAMREALEMARDALKSAEKYVYGDPPNGEAIGWDDVWPSEWHHALEAVERALSAPARNCDLKECSTDDGMISAHERFCESWHDDGKSCAECPNNPRSQMMTCREKWLFAPAAGRKGEGDGR